MKNDKIFHISPLTEILKKDLRNFGKENQYAESSEKMKISLALTNPENFIYLEKYLISLLEKFNQLNKEKNIN
jgi:hypothetical protein